MAFVYIVRSGDANLFKIGRALDLKKRMQQLNTGNPDPLTTFDVIETQHAADCETYLHHRLRSKRSGRSAATEFFEVEPDELAEVIRDARDFVDDFLPKRAEAERLANEQSDDRVLHPGDAEWDAYRRLLEVRVAHDILSLDKERLETELKLAIGTAAGIEGVATWSTLSQRRFDQDKFSREHPDLYNAFLRDARYRKFILL